jgi:hypothetical protein
MELLLLPMWLFLCVAAAMFADIRRKRNGLGWFAVAFFFSPIVAFILLAILEPLPPERRSGYHRRDLDEQPRRGPWDNPPNDPTSAANRMKAARLLLPTIPDPRFTETNKVQ